MILGNYVSEWEERTVRTNCKVNEGTGQISDLGVEDDVYDLEHHLNDYVLVGDLLQYELEAEDGQLTRKGLESLFLLVEQGIQL